ncbi:MAG: glycoside hydrolase family 57 protein [Microgenomates group bacterium]
MPQLCLYFHLHQPHRLSPITIFDVGNDPDYFDPISSGDKEIFHKVAKKSYRPMLGLIKKLLKKHPDFCLSLSISGVFLEQAQEFAPDVITLLKEIIDTKRVEILAETYYHSLASLYSKPEFESQVLKHIATIEKLFDYTPRVFRNTELIYSNEIAALLEDFNFSGVLTEAVDRYLHGRPKTQIFASDTPDKIPLLLKHAQLSDDIAFRFSNKSWDWFPLHSDQYLKWVEVYERNDFVNLFMDFETFGEHQWADTGIFSFFEQFIADFLAKEWNTLVMPSQAFAPYAERRGGIARTKGVLENRKKLPVYDVPDPISWADIDRDITAWRDNDFQYDTLRIMYQIEEDIKNSEDDRLLDSWRKLQISDHFYYMCTKWSEDGDVHAYFSHYDSPYEAYRRFSIALADLLGRVHAHQKSLNPKEENARSLSWYAQLIGSNTATLSPTR